MQCIMCTTVECMPWVLNLKVKRPQLCNMWSMLHCLSSSPTYLLAAPLSSLSQSMAPHVSSLKQWVCSWPSSTLFFVNVGYPEFVTVTSTFVSNHNVVLCQLRETVIVLEIKEVNQTHRLGLVPRSYSGIPSETPLVQGWHSLIGTNSGVQLFVHSTAAVWRRQRFLVFTAP